MIVVRDLQPGDLEATEKVFGEYLEGEELARMARRLRESLSHEPDSSLVTLVAEADGAVEGVLMFRDPHEQLLPFATTARPVELYGLFSLRRSPGIGSALLGEFERCAREGRYEEAVVFSASRWSSSWGFYDAQAYVRAGTIQAEDGMAQVWRKKL